MKIGRSISVAIGTHAALKTGIHGVGAKYLAISSGSDQLITNADVKAAAAIAYSKLNLALAVKNTDIALAAGIVYSKLNLALRILNADIKGDAAIVYSKLNLTGEVLAADIEAAADIPLSKLVDAVCSETEADGKITTHEEGAKHRWTDEKLRKGAGAGAAPDEINIPISLPSTSLLTLAQFQANPASGTCTNPQNVNDGTTASTPSFDSINEYAEIDWHVPMLISQFRYYGDTYMNGDGAYKIQYFNDASQAWVDWKTGIPTRATNDWADWETVSIVYTSKIRIIATTIDTAPNNVDREWEIKY